MIDVKGRYEEDHKTWDDPKYNEGVNTSAREMPISYKFVQTFDGAKYYQFTLFDKCLMKPNWCPKCEKDNTFHHRQQKLGDKFPNIWKHEQTRSQSSLLSVKYDFCLDCHNLILFEYFAFTLEPVKL